MQYKKQSWSIILAFTGIFISSAFSQSFFNTVMGDEFYGGSARDAAMGNHRLTGTDPVTSVRSNPAVLSRLGSEYGINFSLSGKSLLEQRGMPLKDMFGDFLEDGIYVVNRDKTGYGSMALGRGFSLYGMNLGLGIQYAPLSIFHYKYEEEVRAKTSLEDGIIGSKDPLVGFHILNSTGKTDVLSLGMGAGYPINPDMTLNAGFSVNVIGEADYTISQSVEAVSDSDGNLSDVEPFDLIFSTGSETFTTLSANLHFSNGVGLSAAYESTVDLNKSIPDELVDFEPSGLSPELTDHLMNFYLNGINSSFISFPSRTSAGLTYTPRAVIPMVFTLEFEFQPFSDIPGNNYKDTRTWRAGFEYLSGGKVPFRAGYLFKESPMPLISPETAFTVGTGRTFGKVQLDISGRYSFNTYDYPDLFVVDGDVRPDLDTVQETRIDIMASFSFEFGE
ncbi:MAG: hypothetical protein ACE5D7_03875 [Fidelibacterota bacterium]